MASAAICSNVQCQNILRSKAKMWVCKCGGPKCCSQVCFKEHLKEHKNVCQGGGEILKRLLMILYNFSVHKQETV